MDAKDIVNMSNENEDIADGELEFTEEDINILVDELMSIKDLGEDALTEQFVAIYSLWQFLKQPGGMMSIYECEDALSLAECLMLVTQLPWVKDTDFDDLCIGAAYRMQFRHFEYSDDLEKGFAAMDIQHLLTNYGTQIAHIIDELKQLAACDSQFKEVMDKVDFGCGNKLFMDQIQCAMIPSIRDLYIMYPQLEDPEMTNHCNELEQRMGEDMPIQRILQKAYSLCNFIEEKIKAYDAADDDDDDDDDGIAYNPAARYAN